MIMVFEKQKAKWSEKKIATSFVVIVGLIGVNASEIATTLALFDWHLDGSSTRRNQDMMRLGKRETEITELLKGETAGPLFGSRLLKRQMT